MQLFLVEPTLVASEEAPCGKVEVVGSMGLVSRPPQDAKRPQLLGVGLSWASSCPNTDVWPVFSVFALVFGLYLVQLSLNLRFDFICDFTMDQSVPATCKLA